MTDRHEVEAGGVRLAYRVSGRPGAPALVLLHALGEDATGWDGVAPALARHWRVYALDLRGHGRSGHPGEYSLELMRDDVLGVLDALGLDRVDLVGHSMGGVVAYLLAQEHPQRIRRLVLEDVPPPFPREPSTPARPDGPTAFDWAVVPAVRGQLDDPDPAWLERMGRITVPTLVVAGGSRSHLPQDRIAELAWRLPDCRVVTVEAGHMVHNVLPDEFTRVVVAFLRPAVEQAAGG
ncbi:alpha/beta fold hydrolase [Saccharothrix sp. ST-888]|uniref:alpha/beta fold hydrolase n=1 Tax=Saccharothrix sp. ST-888 TaxID=1427391 RepID=UPI0005EC5166|nr:alpha/beta hydrolase [Saccharothrix sp. ST-888]KJK56701.1 alpha/beta hydrolase [Saccharothrix sp. ST-888]